MYGLAMGELEVVRMALKIGNSKLCLGIEEEGLIDASYGLMLSMWGDAEKPYRIIRLLLNDSAKIWT